MSGMIMSVYPRPQRKPSWFTPEACENPKAYAFEQRGKDVNRQFLLYAPKQKQAYFIIRSEE